MQTPKEIDLTYPQAWEQDYRDVKLVSQWRTEFPDQFDETMGSTMPGTLDLFPQYALMYLLRKNKGMQSITSCRRMTARLSARCGRCHRAVP